MSENQATILVVDDNITNVSVLLNSLEAAGHNVRTATSGHAALAAVRDSRPDIILLDALMPDMDGIETLQRLKADRTLKHIPVIFVSTLAEGVHQVKALRLGAVDYLTKPIQIELALRRIQTHLTIRYLQIDSTLVRLEAHSTIRQLLYALKEQVRARTADLSLANAELQVEIAARKQAEIGKTRLFEAERLRRLEAETLQAANLALTETLELERVLGTLLDYLHQLVPYDTANVMLLEKETHLAVYAQRGQEKYVPKHEGCADSNLIRPAALRRFALQSVPANIRGVLTLQKSLIISDITASSDWHFITDMAGTECIQSWIGVPLVAAGKSIGLYSLNKAQAGFFTPEHAKLAEALAVQAAIAVQNARKQEEVRTGQERLQALTRRLIELQEAERRHIAHELHDQFGQILTGLKYTLSTVTKLPPSAAQATLSESRALINDLQRRMRHLTLDLRPMMLDDFGLLPALQAYFKRYTAQTQVQVTFEHGEAVNRRFSAQVETAAYRIIQEALTNIARYARTLKATVRLWVEKESPSCELHLQIIDQGAGFEPQTLVTGNSIGLIGMYERAHSLGGQLTIESAFGAGTCVTATLPAKVNFGDSTAMKSKGENHVYLNYVS